ncbi:unnamed protein product (macronuclear) [Paramecium tetraurelia]|uniref:C2H2-type domain-containing protein n=1 Tax=Paramecium tetraurelia TaxID=5888 RepID=A0CZC2_PARTE|nr:uncharacterized protein GSPATT00011712001 [Paramecium tetraurelia]CAK76139.1 unnamed protein product [Paramecium tetraurelia]|eukprot:XP_001443536.1 hypothetical protein (macronuclear) [Paramecium tetraurelia strain d4-2]
MSEKKQKRKQNDKEDGEWKCLECCKSYLSYPAFYTHCKTKHDSKWPKQYSTPRPLEEIKRDKTKPRTNMDEQKQHEKEDQIFEFLGKLGQSNEEEDSSNNCIRHYLKQPIDPIKSLNDDLFQGTNYLNIYNQVLKELEELNKKVLDQEAIWDFKDPLTLTNELEEFTFSNLKGMFHQLDGQLNVVNVTAIFMGWLSRHLKKNAYQDISIISIITAYFFKNYQSLKSQEVNTEGKLDLMSLDQNEAQHDDQRKKQQEYCKIDKQNDTDLKKEVLSQMNSYLKKEYHKFQNQVSYIRTPDIAQAFFCLLIDWIEAYSDLEDYVEKGKEVQQEKQQLQKQDEKGE